MFVRGQDAPIDFKASRTEEGIVEWVESTMANNIAIEEQKVQEEEPKLNELWLKNKNNCNIYIYQND